MDALRYNEGRMYKSATLLRSVISIFTVFAMGATQAKDFLVVGTTFARIFEQTEQGEYIGLGADLARAIAQQQGIHIKFGIYPWARAQHMVANGLADVLVGPYKSSARESIFLFSDHPFYQDNMVFYKLTESKASWDGSYESLKKKRLVAVLGWTYGAAFNQERTHLGVTDVNTVEGGLTMLLNNRMDFFVANERNTLAGMTALGMPERFTSVTPLIGTEVGYFAFAKGAEHEALRKAFNVGMGKLIASGEYASMARRNNITIPAMLTAKPGGAKYLLSGPPTKKFSGAAP